MQRSTTEVQMRFYFIRLYLNSFFCCQVVKVDKEALPREAAVPPKEISLLWFSEF